MIAADPRWNGGRYDVSNPPLTGLALVRALTSLRWFHRTTLLTRSLFTCFRLAKRR